MATKRLATDMRPVGWLWPGLTFLFKRAELSPVCGEDCGLYADEGEVRWTVGAAGCSPREFRAEAAQKTSTQPGTQFTLESPHGAAASAPHPGIARALHIVLRGPRPAILNDWLGCSPDTSLSRSSRDPSAQPGLNCWTGAPAEGRKTFGNVCSHFHQRKPTQGHSAGRKADGSACGKTGLERDGDEPSGKNILGSLTGTPPRAKFQDASARNIRVLFG